MNFNVQTIRRFVGTNKDTCKLVDSNENVTVMIDGEVWLFGGWVVFFIIHELFKQKKKRDCR